MTLSNIRYPAYPLITVDPFFSVWSMSDELTDDYTRHWTGTAHPLTGIITVDGEAKMFMGKMLHNPSKRFLNPYTIKQTSVEVTPLKTKYVFCDDKVELTVNFITPLLLDDLKLLSRPVSYINYKIRSIDEKEHNCSIYFDFSALLAVNEPDEGVVVGETDYSIFCCSASDDMLKTCGDDHRINWGYLHLAAPNGKTGFANDNQKEFALKRRKFNTPVACGSKMIISESYPVLYYTNDHSVYKAECSDFMCIGYDDICSFEYFGKKICAYYKKDGEPFSSVIKHAIDEFDSVMKRADEFDSYLVAKAIEISEDYAKLIAISYRQTIAAHKLAWDGNEAIFVSKECSSNGCAATVDVTYPSIPLFLIFNPDLVEYMLNPIFKMLSLGKWHFEFAPHDVGVYPLLNGQHYGYIADELQQSFQMPIEECGNIILCVAAACRAKNDLSYAKAHYKLLKQWADYLVKHGYNPENQFCTDDFAGHLAHNCNLSVKAIVAVAAWGMILEMLGEEDEAEFYKAKAKEYAEKWANDAFENDHYRLAFDAENSWSIKYNLVWDKLLGLNVFDKKVFKTEIEYYKTKINKYGLPLDCRSTYTKSDWQLWSTEFCDDKEYSDRIISAMVRMLSDAPIRAPFSDWYHTDNAIQLMFQNRSVQGALFIKMLKFS